MKPNTSAALEPNSEPTPEYHLSLDNGPTGEGLSQSDKNLPVGPGPIRQAWNRWLKVAEVIGTIQMLIILSILYWLILPLMAIPFKLLSDPLRIKRPSGSNWQEKKRDESISVRDSMNNQY